MEQNIIIWWCSRVWKSILASSISDDFWHRIHSWDEIREKLYNSLWVSDKQKFMQLMYYLREYKDWETKKWNDSFEKLILEKNIYHYLALEQRTNRYVFSEKISRILTSKYKVLTEWVQNTPKWVYEFLNNVKNPEKYKVIFLVKSDIDSILEGFKTDPWSFLNRDAKMVFDFLQCYSDLILKQSNRYWFDCIDTSWDFFSRILEAKQLLVNR